MNSTELSTLAGILISLVFSYTPRLKDWFNALDPHVKRLIMLGVLAASALTVYGASCGGLSIPGVSSVTCDQAGATGLFNSFIVAMIANQSTYMITPTELPKKVGG